MNSDSLIGRNLSASLTVEDLTKSLQWYTAVFGFSIAQKFEREGRLTAVSLQAGDVRILLTQDDGSKGSGRTRGEGFSLQITTDQPVDSIAAAIRSHGGTLDSEPADFPWGQRAFRLSDPDGFKFTISSGVPGRR